MTTIEMSLWTGIIVGILTILGVLMKVIHYFNLKFKEVSDLNQKIEKITLQNEQLRDTLSSSYSPSVTSAFDDLKQKSEELGQTFRGGLLFGAIRNAT